MAKRKRKSKATRKTARKTTVRRKKGIFWGDGFLAFFYFLQAFFILGGIGILACIGFNLEFAVPLKGDLIKNVPDPDVINFLNSLDQTKGIGLAVAVIGLIPLVFLFLRGIARSNRIALLLVVILEGVNIWFLISSTKNEARFGAILPIIILVYALLRIGGGLGPKIR